MWRLQRCLLVGWFACEGGWEEVERKKPLNCGAAQNKGGDPGIVVTFMNIIKKGSFFFSPLTFSFSANKKKKSQKS